jgi:hypothetical protein
LIVDSEEGKMKITALTGPYAGRTRGVDDRVVDPYELLRGFVDHGHEWSVDYSSAVSERERLAWAIPDLACRSIRALRAGRPVWFEGVEYRAERPGDVPRVAGEIEDAMVYSGHYVKLESDDEHGVVIGIGPPERPVQ